MQFLYAPNSNQIKCRRIGLFFLKSVIRWESWRFSNYVVEYVLVGYVVDRSLVM